MWLDNQARYGCGDLDTSSMVLDTREVLAKNLNSLLAKKKEAAGGGSRLDFSREIGVADGTLGRISYGSGNPTLDVMLQLAEHFRLEPWQLLAPDLGRNLVPRADLDNTSDIAELGASIAEFMQQDPTLRDAILALMLRYETNPKEGAEIAEAIKTLVKRRAG